MEQTKNKDHFHVSYPILYTLRILAVKYRNKYGDDVLSDGKFREGNTCIIKVQWLNPLSWIFVAFCYCTMWIWVLLFGGSGNLSISEVYAEMTEGVFNPEYEPL